MGNGAHGDLHPVRYLLEDTPVNYIETNEPLEDLEANILIMDGKFAEHLANHPGGTGGGGGGGGGSATSTGTRTLPIDKFLSASGGTDPSAGTVGTDIDSLDFADGATESQKLEFTIPADYDSGDVLLYVQFAMDGSSGGNVDFDIDGEIAAIDDVISAFGTTTVNVAVQSNTNPDEALLWTFAEGTVNPGDRVRLDFLRKGTTDSNSDTFQMMGMVVNYTGILVPSGTYTTVIDFTLDTDETAPTPGTLGTDLETLDHDPSTDNEQKFISAVPDEWDGTSDPRLRIAYAMSTSVASKIVRIGTEGEVADVVNGAINALTAQQTDVAVPSDTSVTRTVDITFPASKFSKGSVFVVKAARRNSGVTGNHTGNWKVLSYEMIWNTPSAAGVAVSKDSRSIDMTFDIPTITAPTPVTTGTRSNALRFADGATNGQFVEFNVPENYDNGDLVIFMICRTGAAVASPNNVIRTSTDGELFDISASTVNSISSEDLDVTVADNTTGPKKVTLRTLFDGTFSASDRVQFGFQRLGGHANDLLGQALDVLSFGYEYNI